MTRRRSSLRVALLWLALVLPAAGQLIIPQGPPPAGGPAVAPAAAQPVPTQQEPEDDIRDIREPIPRTFWERHGLAVSVGSVVALALAGLLARRLLRRKPVSPPSPYEIARRELEAAKVLCTQGADEALARALSDAVRRYLENGYQLPAPERTTEEFLEALARESRLPSDAARLLGEFLAACDLAKFARHAFHDAERGELYARAVRFVDEAERARQPVHDGKGGAS